MISALVITKNESATIAGCLESLAWVDEVVVVDSGSTDDTVELAQQSGARVFQNPWPGYSQQRNFAIERCSGDWILYLDADERLSPGFRDEARAIEASGAAAMSGYWVSSLEYFMGDFLRFGGYGLHQHNRKLRFWRSDPRHRFSGRVHERITALGATGQFRAHVEHYSSASTVAGMLDKLNAYTTLDAGNEGNATALQLVWQPSMVFLSRYLKRAGYRDGLRGFVAAHLNAFYRFVVLAKALEAARISHFESTTARYGTDDAPDC